MVENPFFDSKGRLRLCIPSIHHHPVRTNIGAKYVKKDISSVSRLHPLANQFEAEENKPFGHAFTL